MRITLLSLVLAGCEICPGSCGCWEPVTLDVSFRVVDDSGAAVSGVDAVCVGEAQPVTTSDSEGTVRFVVQTEESESCLYRRCTLLRLRDPAERYAEYEDYVNTLDGSVVTLEAVETDTGAR